MDKEYVAVVRAVMKFCPYLYGRSFSVFRDQPSLYWQTSLQDPSGRLARWSLRLEEFDMSRVYKSTRQHYDTDCLSRSSIEPGVTVEDMSFTGGIDMATIARPPREDRELIPLNYVLDGRIKNAPVEIDLIESFRTSNTGNEWVIVATDYLTCYAETKAFSSGTAVEAAQFFDENVVLRHGAPMVIKLTDGLHLWLHSSRHRLPLAAKLIERPQPIISKQTA